MKLGLNELPRITKVVNDRPGFELGSSDSLFSLCHAFSENSHGLTCKTLVLELGKTDFRTCFGHWEEDNFHQVALSINTLGNSLKTVDCK